MGKKIGAYLLWAWAGFALGLLAVMTSSCSTVYLPESYLRKATVQLFTATQKCSGISVRTPTGMDYVLTAAHCRSVESPNFLTAKTEDGRSVQLKVIAEDPTADLLLLEGISNYPHTYLGSYTYPGQQIFTLAHGRGLAVHKTAGELIQIVELSIPLAPIKNAEDLMRCRSQPKKQVMMMEDDEGDVTMGCALTVSLVATTAKCIPGASGGPVFDEDGRLVGIISATGQDYGYVVGLSDVARFLSAH